MKLIKLIPFLICIVMLNMASTCSNDDDNTNSSSDPTPVVNLATQGTWRITSYIDSGVSKTNQFTGYNFTFAASNVLNSSNATTTYSGTWSVTSHSSNDDNPNSDLDFNIDFISPTAFADLSDDWDVVSYNATTISLIDISGGNGGTDTLIFTKN